MLVQSLKPFCGILSGFGKPTDKQIGNASKWPSLFCILFPIGNPLSEIQIQTWNKSISIREPFHCGGHCALYVCTFFFRKMQKWMPAMLPWNGIHGRDMLCCAVLCNNDICSEVERRYFSWTDANVNAEWEISLFARSRKSFMDHWQLVRMWACIEFR